MDIKITNLRAGFHSKWALSCFYVPPPQAGFSEQMLGFEPSHTFFLPTK